MGFDLREEGESPPFFRPSERASGAWAKGKAGPLFARGGLAGAGWRLGAEPLLSDAELVQSHCNGLAIRRNSSQSVAIGAIEAIKQ